jgi:hypothetical protein
MSVYLLKEDFDDIMMRAGIRSDGKATEAVLRDAWDIFASFNGSAREFAERMKKEKPHWYAPEKQPDTSAHRALYSVDAQSQFVREHSVEELTALLAQHGLTPGRTLKAKPPSDDDFADDSSNPYSPKWKGTLKQAQDKIGSMISAPGGHLTAARLAKKFNKTLDGKALRA